MWNHLRTIGYEGEEVHHPGKPLFLSIYEHDELYVNPHNPHRICVYCMLGLCCLTETI